MDDGPVQREELDRVSLERERVKAEIDAANRIQAALLPPPDQKLHGWHIGDPRANDADLIARALSTPDDDAALQATTSIFTSFSTRKSTQNTPL